MKYLKIFKYLIFRKFQNWSDINVVFIIGTGRTGTEFISDYLNKFWSSAVMSVHEPSPDLLRLSVNSRKYKWPKAKIVRELYWCRKEYLNKVKSTRTKFFIESNNNASFLLPYLKQVFPNIKIIYFTRNPESFLISEMNKRHGIKKFRIFSADDSRARITPDLMEQKNIEILWANWSREYKILWHWVACNTFILNHIKDFEYLKMKYEDFFENDASVIKMLNFIGLDSKIDEDKLRALIVKKNSSKHQDFLNLDDFNIDFKKYFVKKTCSLKKELNY